MDPSHLDELIQLEESYWWHVAKRRLVRTILQTHFPPPAKLVEGGIGSSRNLQEFQELGYQVAGFDLMDEAVAHGRNRGLDELRVHDLTQPWPLDGESMDVAVLLDVLEHMPNPVEVLRHASKVLKPGGGLVITVPAHPWLFGDWDKRLGHYRRYTARELRRHADAAELTIERLTYWNAFSLPAAIAVRGIQRVFPQDRRANFPRVSPAINRVLLSLATAERWWMQRSGVPFGLSLVGVLQK